MQLGTTKIFMKPEVAAMLDAPRRAARGRATLAVQAFARRRLARRVVSFGRAHAAADAAARAVLDLPLADHAVETIEVRIGDAAFKLDELIEIHEQSHLPMSLAPLLGRCHERRVALEVELRALAHGLQAEVEATAQLLKILRETPGKSKDTFLLLRAAAAAAREASQDLSAELAKAIKEAEASIEARFVDLVSEWEAEVGRQAAAREEARRQRCRQAAAELTAQMSACEREAAARDARASLAAVSLGGAGVRRGSMWARGRCTSAAAAPPAHRTSLAAAVGARVDDDGRSGRTALPPPGASGSSGASPSPTSAKSTNVAGGTSGHGGRRSIFAYAQRRSVPYVRMHTRAHACVCMHARIRIRHARVHVCTCVCMAVCIRACV